LIQDIKNNPSLESHDHQVFFLIGNQKTFINDRKKEEYKKFMMMNN